MVDPPGPIISPGYDVHVVLGPWEQVPDDPVDLEGTSRGHEAHLDGVLPAEQGHGAPGAVERAAVVVGVGRDHVHAVLYRLVGVVGGQGRWLPLK